MNKFSNPLAGTVSIHNAYSGAYGLCRFRRKNVVAVIVAWFPGVGYRLNTDGTLGYVGSRGHYWSSSINASGSTNGGYINFNSDGTLNPVNNTNRANGFAVRCVSELVQMTIDLGNRECNKTNKSGFCCRVISKFSNPLARTVSIHYAYSGAYGLCRFRRKM